MDIIGVQLIADKMLNLTPKQVDELIENGEDYDALLQERFGVDFSTFVKIVNALILLTPIIQDPRSNDLIHAFVTFHNGHGQIIASQKYNA